MKIKIMGAMVAATALLSGCDFKQANPTCILGHGEYIVKYVPVDPAADTCGLPGGELIGMQRYAPTKDRGAIIAIRAQPEGLRGEAAFEEFIEDKVENDERPWTEVWVDEFSNTFSRAFDLGDSTIGVGQFPEADAPNADGFCEVSDFGFTASASAAEAIAYNDANFILDEVGDDEFEWTVVEDPSTEVIEGAQTVSYAFTDTKFYVSARSAGVTFTSNLTYTSTIEGVAAGDATETCTAEFTAVGMFPAANIYGIPNQCETVADCDPCPFNPEGRYTAGSGINPDLQTACDPNVYGGWCVLAGTELPGFRSDTEIQEMAEECAARSDGE